MEKAVCSVHKTEKGPHIMHGPFLFLIKWQMAGR